MNDLLVNIIYFLFWVAVTKNIMGTIFILATMKRGYSTYTLKTKWFDHALWLAPIVYFTQGN